MTASEPPELVRAEDGLEKALTRLQKSASHDEQQQATSEILGWLYQLEEWHKTRLQPARYYQARDASKSGQVVGGLMYARGLVQHGSATVEELVEGAFDQNAFSANAFDVGILTWKPFADLPPPGRPETHNRDELYQKRLEGKPVLETLIEGRDFLTNDVKKV